MEMPRFTHSYKGGMNKDISPNEYPNTCYLDARNLRIIVDSGDGLGTAALTTPKGNLASFTLPTLTYYLGHTVLREKLVILAKHDLITDLKPDKVYVLDLSDLITGTNLTVSGTHLVYEQDLNFSLTDPIKVVGNYENADIQKIYWVDGINPLRHLNIVTNPDYNDLSTLDPELLNILPNHTYGSYELTELAGGHLKAGRIQYSYQLYSISGTETMFAPPSRLYNLTSYDSSDGTDFIGDEIEKEVNKSIRVTINLNATVTSTFNRIRLVALEYETYGDVPTTRVVAELELGNSSISFTDSGNSIGELLLEEFQQIRNEITPTTIETKNNYLFAANITQEFFDIDDLVKEITDDDTAFLDTRAYRWRYVEAGVGLGSGSQVLNDLTDPDAILNTPGYPNAAQAYDVDITEAYNTSWHIHVTIRPDLHAAAQVPVRTVTGISSLNGLGCNIRLRTAGTMIWDEQGIALNFDGAYIDGYDPVTHSISIRGTKYWGTPPQDLTPPWSYGNYDADALTQFSYTYTYTYPLTGTSGFECTINKTHPVDGLPGTSLEFVLDSGTGPHYDEVDEKNDCINTYNNISNDYGVNFLYKYKHGVTGLPEVTDLGGTGEFISFSFITETLTSIATRRSIGGAPSINYVLDPTTFNSYANPQVIIDYTSFQRDEVYRFAIVFYDLKGRPSFSKWIADIRFPDVNEYLSERRYSNAFNFTSVDATNPDETVNVVALGIEFTINWFSINTEYPGLLDQLSGFQIVRTPRTDLDCTIKAQGLIVPTHIVTTPDDPTLKDSNYSSYNITSGGDYETGAGGVTQITDVTGTNSTLDDTLVELLSPEIVINKNLDIDEDDFLEVIGHISNISAGSIVITPSDQKSYTVVATTMTPFDARPLDLLTDFVQEINDAYISLPEAKLPTTRVIGGTSYTARGYDDDIAANFPEMTYKGTSLVANIAFPFNNVTPLDYVAGDEQALYGRYRRSLGYSIYGGATYPERSYSNYIDVSGFIEVPETYTVGGDSYSTYNGDTYIAPFNFLKLFYDYNSEYKQADGENSGQVLVGFPTESRINLHYKLDNIPKYFTTPDTPPLPLYYLAEQYSTGISQYPSGYPDINDLYRYNSAYSAESLGKTFLPKAFDYRSSKVNDVMVTSSEKKYNGEYSDSWLKFKFNNYLELEGEYGAITRLINNNEKLITFQPRGIAVLSVLERELVETNNTASLVVGSGGILSRYDYISKTIGTSLYYAITPTENGIYFYDDKNIAIYRILDAIEPISDTKGMKSYFESNQYQSMITTYDRANREVLFSPLEIVTTIPATTTIYYGALYNWYAVTDPREIANTGWHVPTLTEYETLSTYLGGDIVSGGKLKSTGLTYWNSPNTGATNEVGFNARGSGYRQGFFNNLKVDTYLWTTTLHHTSLYAGTIYLRFNSEAISTSYTTFTGGYAIRLIKDSTTLIHGQTGTYVGNDGKTYQTICIGTQEWVADNIAETKYRDNSDIPLVENQSTWNGLLTSGMCYYNNDINMMGYTIPENYIFNNTLCFSGYIDAFSGFYTFNTQYLNIKNYITFDKYLLSSLDGRVFYIHNIGDYNNFYGDDKTSTLTLITNPLKNNVVTFHTIDWLTDLTTAGIEIPDDLIHTFDTLQITNTHQDTGVLLLDDWIASEDLKRRFRKWRINTFRDSTDEGRIRDSWIKSHFTWEQKAINKKLVVHPIDYLYLPTKIR